MGGEENAGQSDIGDVAAIGVEARIENRGGSIE
jgi:hypothetical protein